MKDNNTTQELSQIEKRRLANRLSYQRNREKRLKACTDYYYKNQKKYLQYNNDYQKVNKEAIKLSNSEYYSKNKENRQQYNKRYHKENKEKIKLVNREYVKKRRKTDSYYRLVRNIRTRMYGAIKQQLSGKSTPTFNLLGCTVSEFTKHIEEQFEPGMNWGNYNKHGWHVDHIIPCNTFNLTDPEQQKQCFHYTNLRPLWAKENYSRPKDGSDIIS